MKAKADEANDNIEFRVDAEMEDADMEDTDSAFSKLLVTHSPTHRAPHALEHCCFSRIKRVWRVHLSYKMLLFVDKH